MVIKMVIDACVIIDLDNPHVNFIEGFLKCLGDDEIYISTVNFEEVHDRRLQDILSKSDNVSIVPADEEKFRVFSNELEPLRINLARKDRHVLFLADELKADYVVSSDLNVIDKSDKYRRHMRFKHMKTLTTVSLLEYFYLRERIEYNILLEKGLYLFKHKEIDNIMEHLSDENLNVSKQKQIEIINEYKITFKERFEIYREPIVSQFRHLLSQGGFKYVL